MLPEAKTTPFIYTAYDPAAVAVSLIIETAYLAD
jgi:hypothetical protein